MKNIKVCFCGSHGTGKSSASTYLAALLKQHNRSKSVKVIEENVREIAHLFNNKLNNTKFQMLCMIDHLHKELTAEQVYDIIVCDRTAIDTLVYGLTLNVAIPGEYFSLAMNSLNSFNHVFFVRPDSDQATLAEDGFRDTNVDMRNKVDEQFKRMLDLWGGSYTEIRSKDIYNFPYLETINK